MFRHPRQPFLAAVGESHRRGDLQVGAQLVDEGRRYLDAQLSVFVDADGFVPAGLARLALGGEKHPRRTPFGAPLLFSHVSRFEVIAGAP